MDFSSTDFDYFCTVKCLALILHQTLFNMFHKLHFRRISIEVPTISQLKEGPSC